MAKKNENTEFVNPFTPGVDYDMFLDASGNDVEGYCKEHLTKEQIEWLLNDLKFYKK